MTDKKTRNIPFSPPDITDEDINEVVDAMKSGWITTGPRTKEFEKRIAEYVGVNKAVCLNSATAAMELTLRILGVGQVVETLLEIIKDRTDKSLKVLALIDDNKERQNKELLGYKIICIDDIKKYEHDGIVITSYTFEDDIRKILSEVGYPEDKVERFFGK